jgi:M6 family metalloprotease-like protein
MTKKLTFLLGLFIMTIMSQAVFAVPAVPWPVEKVQPDGTKISVHLRGDEKVHWMESTDGYTLMYDAKKFIVYADQDGQGNLIPSNVKFGAKSERPVNLKKGLQYSPAQVQALKKIWEITSDTEQEQSRSSGQQKAGATTGNRQALCVLMGFGDKSFSKSRTEFETLFNQVGLYNSTTKGSVRDFFRENSYGQLDLTVTIVGPYTAPNTREYYATHEREFATIAANAANADIDFQDYADNGILETFHILFAGYGDESIGNGKQIWSHKWQLTSPITLDGVRISVYSCSPELEGSSGSTTTHIGVICHELTHVFGAPDYYDTGTVGYTGSGNWDLMAGGNWNDGGRQPAHINMFQKILFGWVTPTELTSYTEVPAMLPSAQNPVAYTIKANNNGELYVLENRQKVGFDTSLPGHGLLIWHVHPSALGGNGSNAGHPQQLYPVVASSAYNIPTGLGSYGNINSAGTPFPGSANKNAFTSKTTPTMFTWTGSQPIAKPITEIKEETDNTVSFKFLDGPTTPVTNLQAVVMGGNVTLSWTATDHPEVLGYKVYRDDILQYTINNKTSVTYTQIGVTNGTYVYGVTAYYESTESEKITQTVTVDAGPDTYMLPVQNLQGRATLDKAYLNWTAPFNGGWMTIAGSADGAYRFDATFTFFAGTLWGPEHLKGLDGYEATQIQFYMNETAAAATHTVQIWEVDDNGIPQLKRSQAYTGTRSAGLKTVTLTSSLALDASKEYLIGVEIHTVGGSCFVVDANPIVPLRNWICEEGEWFPMEYLEFENNFVTSVYLNSGNPSLSSAVLDSRTLKTAGNNMNTLVQKAKTSPEKRSHLKAVRSEKIEAGPSQVAPRLISYAIYRNGVQIGTSTTNSFEDSGLTAGASYSYCVSAVYNNGNASEGICMELNTLSLVNAFNPVEDIKAKVAGDEVTLSWTAPYSGGTATYIASSTSNPATTTVNTATTTEAIRFDSNDLKRMEGFNITKVRFHPGNSNTARTYTIQIWSGGNGSTPGTLVYEQPTTLTNNVWNDITLTTPVPVNIYEDLWIGVKITRTGASGSYPSPRYSSSTAVVDGKSNWMHNNTSWSKVSNVVWPISATIAPGASVSSLTGYTITRNGDNLAEVTTSTFSYLDEGLQPGDYNYCVTAVYGANESDPACTSATAEKPVNPYKAVQNLNANLDENKATLSWTAPFAGGQFGHSTLATSYSAYNLTGIIAARFTKEELKALLGMQLTQVRFLAHSTVTTSNTTYTLRIYAGAKGNEPERVIHEQSITAFSGNAWNTVTLSTPVDINVYEDFWIGIVVASRGGTAYRMACDVSQPAADGKGNVMYYNNRWQTLLEAGGGDYNWAILGIAAPSSGSGAPAFLSHQPISIAAESVESQGDFRSAAIERIALPDKVSVPEIPLLASPQVFATPDNYIISRNGVEIATVASSVLTAEDILSTTGDYTYSVVAQYADGSLSDAKAVTVSFVSECDARPENVTAVRTGNLVAIDWDFTPSIVREEILFREDFESGIPATWSNLDNDGDAKIWQAASGTGASGTGYVYSASYEGTTALTPDNWLISPAITLTKENRLNFYAAAYQAAYPDYYGVFISTTDNAIASFGSTPIFEEELPKSTAWEKKTVDLSAYEGETVYIAFRHYNCTDQYRILLDNVTITKNAVPVFNVYQNDVLLGDIAGEHYDVTLTENGTFNYCVTFKGRYCESEPVCADAVDFYQLEASAVIADKVYDTTTDATVQTVTFTGLDGDDQLTENTDYTVSATFSDSNVGTGIPASVTVALLPTAIVKYWLPITTITASGNITPAETTVSGLTANNKVYDGTITATATGTATLEGVLNADDVVLSGTPVYDFVDTNAGSSKNVTVSGFVLDGAQKDNYALTPPILSADITPAEITVSGLTANNKVYDRTTTLPLPVRQSWKENLMRITSFFQNRRLMILSMQMQAETKKYPLENSYCMAPKQKITL